jgi:hypothetical protein
MRRPDPPFRLMLLSRSRYFGTVIASLAIAVAGATPTLAEELPPQATADNGEWLPFAPAPAQPGGICLVDSGVNLNPDTEGQVIVREAVDGGTPGDVSPIEHGTLMAMEAAAPPNGWGMIGAAPAAVRIVSVRAESSTDALTVAAYKQAIVECQDLAERRPGYNLKVISMSIGFQSAPPPEQLAQLEDAAMAARGAGLNLVAAAGDEGSAVLSYPAAASSVLAVGAYGANRAPCSFSNGGAVVPILAPGCDLGEADPRTGAPQDEYAGTSQAAAIMGAVLAALRAYEPELGPSEAEQLVISTARATGGALDIAALFQGAGLGSLIAAGQSAAARVPAIAPATVNELQRTSMPRLPMPRVKVMRRGARWLLRFLNMPTTANTVVTVLRVPHRTRHGAAVRWITKRGAISVRLPMGSVLGVRYSAVRAGTARASAARILRL